MVDPPLIGLILVAAERWPPGPTSAATAFLTRRRGSEGFKTVDFADYADEEEHPRNPRNPRLISVLVTAQPGCQICRQSVHVPLRGG
ncbi:MAG: hypothetical protein C5B50_21055 [Verrucomicrobia bacterium]|nr:MAG: hypothetical protein C5B50_21055 [Verrucomicrobiota bacterium]